MSRGAYRDTSRPTTATHGHLPSGRNPVQRVTCLSRPQPLPVRSGITVKAYGKSMIDAIETRPVGGEGGFIYSQFRVRAIQAPTTPITAIPPQTIQNPAEVSSQGIPPTFIPKTPESRLSGSTIAAITVSA